MPLASSISKLLELFSKICWTVATSWSACSNYLFGKLFLGSAWIRSEQSKCLDNFIDIIEINKLVMKEWEVDDLLLLCQLFNSSIKFFLSLTDIICKINHLFSCLIIWFVVECELMNLRNLPDLYHLYDVFTNVIGDLWKCLYIAAYLKVLSMRCKQNNYNLWRFGINVSWGDWTVKVCAACTLMRSELIFLCTRNSFDFNKWRILRRRDIRKIIIIRRIGKKIIIRIHRKRIWYYINLTKKKE